MKVNNREYEYTIVPRVNKIQAKIYQVVEKSIGTFKYNTHILLLDKTFSKWYRKPIKEDYIKAREWAEEQIQCIFHANK